MRISQHVARVRPSMPLQGQPAASPPCPPCSDPLLHSLPAAPPLGSSMALPCAGPGSCWSMRCAFFMGQAVTLPCSMRPAARFVGLLLPAFGCPEAGCSCCCCCCCCRRRNRRCCSPRSPPAPCLPQYMEGGDLSKSIGQSEMRWYKRGRHVALDIARGLGEHSVLGFEFSSLPCAQYHTPLTRCNSNMQCASSRPTFWPWPSGQAAQPARLLLHQCALAAMPSPILPLLWTHAFPACPPALFAAWMHASSFIHLDLKPANILLAADGTAKVSVSSAENVFCLCRRGLPCTGEAARACRTTFRSLPWAQF